MQDPFLRFGRFNQGNSSDISGFGGGQQVTPVTRRVSNDSPAQLSTLDPFLPSRFQAMLPPMDPSMNGITHRRFDDDDDDDDDSPPSPPSKPDSSMITHHRIYSDGFPSPFPSKVEPPEETPRYSSDETDHFHYPRDNIKRLPKPPKEPLRNRGNPVNLNGNLGLRPEDLRQLYPGNDNFNGQTGGGGYNPQVQGGNKVGGDGKITLGLDINGGNINIGGGKAGGGNVGGKKKNKDDDSSGYGDDDDRAK